MKIKMKTISSPRSYLFQEGKLAKTVRVDKEIHISKGYQQELSRMANNAKTKKLPISITHFRKQKQPSNDQANILQISTTRQQKSLILNSRTPNHQISQQMKNPQSLDQTDSMTCRSHSKRKRGRFFLNLSKTNLFGNKMSKDKQITTVIRNEDSLFHEKPLSLHKTKLQLTTKRTQNNETLIKQSNKYELIGSTMRKLKNLSQIKLLQQKRSRRLQTTSQQWDCIEGIIEKINFPMNNNNQCHVQQQQPFPKNDVAIIQPIRLIENFEQQDGRDIQQQTLHQIQLESTKKQQQAETDFSEDNQQKQTNELFECQKIPFIQHKKEIDVNNKFLLIFQRIFHKVDFIIPKVQDLCVKYMIESGKSMCLFLKVLFFNRKIVEIILLQEKETRDIEGNIQQIKQENQIIYEILNGMCSKYNKSLSKKPKLSAINVPQNTNSIESLRRLIQQEKHEYISSNIKTLRKILKNISKDQKTVEKQLQIFLNYGACFINLLKSHQIIQNIINNDWDEQQFFQNECNFIQQKYLEFDEIQFERHFADQKGHQEIEDYYHGLIKQIKNVGQMHSKK